MQLSDGILLRRFCENCDQAAFRALVDRHLPLVYSTALRILRSADLAQDVSQQTFVRLVRKAGGIRRESGLVPWLHLTARALAIDSLRSERRRQAREMKSVSLMTAPTSPSPDWEALAPVIDDVLARLPATDRTLILLRYYEGRPLPAIAAAMGMGEHAVRKRALRALEKLRVLFQKRGISTTASALGVLLPMHASAAVPAGLATSVSSAALAVAPAAGSGAFFSFIAMTTTTKLAAGLAAIAAIAAVTVTLRHFPSGTGDPASASGKSSQVAGNAQPAPVPRHAAPGTRPTDSDLSRFQAILRLTDPAEREARLSGYFASLSASSFAALVPRFAELGIIPDSAEAKGFYLAWAKLDPGAALISARFINPALAGVLMTGWMREDQEAAIAWATSQTDLNGNPNPAFVKMVLPSLAILDPQRAIGLLQHLPSDPATAEYQDWVVRDAGLGGAIYEIVSALQTRPERLKELISSIADPALRRKAALAALQEFSGASAMMSDGNLVRATVSGDSPAVRTGQAVALAWLAEEPGLAVGFSVSNLFHEVAAGDPQQALTALDRLPAGSSARGAAVSGMVTSIVDRSGPAAGLSFLDQHPEDVTPDALREWRYQSEKKDPALVMENAPRFGDGTDREEVIGRTLQIWQKSDPAAAEAWMRIHPDDAGRQSAWEKNHLMQEPLSGN